MTLVCVFDVNETLVDLSGLDAAFDDVFGSPGARRDWFSQLLASALVATVTDAYADFGAIGRSALEMVALRRSIEVTEDEASSLLAGLRSLPPHADVVDALTQLRASGMRMATLTNGTTATAMGQLEHAGLAGFFERILSADTVRRLKPAREPYEMAARELGVDIGEMRLVAAHAWDVAGAMRAGARAAFVARPGMVLDPLAPVPDIIGADLGEVVRLIMKTAPTVPDPGP